MNHTLPLLKKEEFARHNRGVILQDDAVVITNAGQLDLQTCEPKTLRLAQHSVIVKG